MTDYAKWDKFADDISDDDKPRTELKLPKARAHSARAFPGRLIACVENVENAYPHYYDWTMINDGDDGESESNVSLANVRRASSAEEDDAATVEPAKLDDDSALPLPMHELFAAVAAAYASSDAAKATTLYEKAAAIALKCGSASAGVYLSKAAALE